MTIIEKMNRAAKIITIIILKGVERMKSKRHLLPVLLLAFILLFAFSASAFADDLDDLAYPQRPDGETTSMEYVASYILQSVGLQASALGEYPLDHTAMAQSVGLLAGIDFDPTAECDFEDFLKMTANARPLFEALRADPPTPFFVNGMAQPIFPYGNSAYFDTSGEGVARYVVYVETNYDSDADGQLDLVKVLVQLPRAAVEKGMKVSTIYEARPYIEGTNGSVHVNAAIAAPGNAWLAANGAFTHERLHDIAPPRVPAGETDTRTMVENADYHDWYYRYTYNQSGFSASVAYDTGSENVYENLNWYDYYIVRGFAVVSSAGLGAVASGGLSTYGADIEIDAFKCIIEWLTGDRKAYAAPTGNIEIKADWSNGFVGMTGRSYAGTTPFGIATSGIKGLKTIVPVAGIASYYDYQNQQGRINGSTNYTPGMAWYINSRLASADWLTVLDRQAGYLQQMLAEATALGGNYGEHWARRDYTLEGWYEDWGPSKIQTPMLIVHGSNDDNVRPKQSMLMYQAAKKAGVDVRVMWHQGEHMTPTFPSANPTATDTFRPFTMYCGDYLFDEWLNMWFSHYLYDLDNNILDIMPGALVHNNHTGKWDAYDSWDTPYQAILGGGYYVEPADYAGGNIVTVNSANGTGTWANLLSASTAGSALYAIELPEDFSVRGVVEVHFRAAIASLGNNAAEPLGVHAKLVEIAAPDTTINRYGTNNVGGSPARVMELRGGHYIGGGAANYNLVSFAQTSGTYREIAKGWMDLCNPDALYASYTSAGSINPRDNIGVYHDYILYLQPNAHTALKGNKLALLLTTGATSTAAYTGNNAFTFTIDNSATYTVIPAEGELPPPPATVNVNFPGIAGATVQYYTNVAGWQTVGVFDDTCQFIVPKEHLATVGSTTVQVLKGGMWYTFSGLDVGEGKLVLDVPIETITLTGIAAACDLAIVQNDWAYPYTPAAVGAPNEFAVFDNGKKYEARLYKQGFYPINIAGIDAGQALDVSSYFYPVIVPDGVTNVWISSYDWAVRGATAGDLIALLQDPANIKDAQLRFDYEGVTRNISFKLDGADPFAGLL